jgi:hypothetical protein
MFITIFCCMQTEKMNTFHAIASDFTLSRQIQFNCSGEEHERTVVSALCCMQTEKMTIVE